VQRLCRCAEWAHPSLPDAMRSTSMPTIMPMSVVAVSCMHDDKVVQNHALHAELMLSWMTPSQYKAIWQGAEVNLGSLFG
jgi:hypothetical protein